MQKTLLLAQSSRGLPLPLNAIFDTPTFRTREATWVHCTLRPARDFALLSFRILPCVPCIAWPSHLPLYMSPQAVRAITLALEFKGFGSPRFYRPLRAPVMAHATYRHELRAGMRAYITRSIRAVTPFLVPKTSASFAKHPHVSQLLFNHKDALRAWAAKNPPRCCCGQLRQWAPEDSPKLSPLPLLPVPPTAVGVNVVPPVTLPVGPNRFWGTAKHWPQVEEGPIQGVPPGPPSARTSPPPGSA